MAEVTKMTPSTFCWVDLATSDENSARSFYTDLFNWQFEEMPTGPATEGMPPTYSMSRVKGKYVAGLSQITPDRVGQPTAWTCYVGVEDVDHVTDQAGKLGATILLAPFDVLSSGRMSLIQDPTGAVLGLWQPKEHIGSEIFDEPGALTWNELATTDVATATEFYTELFGWTTQTIDAGGSDYVMLSNGDKAVGGISALGQGTEGIPPNWTACFAVTDTPASVAKVEELGGTVIVPATDSSAGPYAVLQDPQGAVFSVITPAQASPAS